MKHSYVLPSIVLVSGLALPATGVGKEKEFNWVPSGVIDVGNRASEAASKYEANGEIQTLTLAYRGEKPGQVIGRLVTGPERFVIRPASWREGPATAHLVICRVVDTDNVPGTLAVSVDGKVVGEWTIRPPPGERRLHDAFFVIPRAVFPNRKPPEEVPVAITPAKIEGGAGNAALSLGYRFYAVRDWDVLRTAPAGDLRAATTKTAADEGSYLDGLLLEGDHDWAGALEHFEQAARLASERSDTAEMYRLARVAVRRAGLRVARADARAADEDAGLGGPALLGSTDAFHRHYRLGLYAGACGVWDDALKEFRLAVQADPTHADATYRLAEAMEYNRLPVAQWAPIMERAGMLGEARGGRPGQSPAATSSSDCNIEDVLIAVHTEAVEGLCGKFTKASLDNLLRDWRYVEQMVYGASLGAWKLRTHFMICGPSRRQDAGATLPWVMQAGWIFLPPDEAVPVEGTYDYSIGTAEYGSSHAGGADCGVSGAGGAQIGPNRGWEVWLHEWNHEFDWVCISGEEVPGYPVTHDSDGCGKQPIVNMGCGHRSSMRYYINRAQYRRHEASDPVVPEALVGKWMLGPVVAAPQPPNKSVEALANWLLETKRLTPERIEQLKRDWENEKKQERQRAEKPPIVESYPPPEPVPDWPGFLRAHWNRTRLLDELVAPGQADFVSGLTAKPSDESSRLDADEDFVDLRRALPDAPEKCVAYARSYIYSPKDQEVRLWIGYNDCAALWLNGRRIHKGNYYACAKWEDLNRPYMLAKSGRLMEGWNCLAVKVERGGGDWGFSVHVVDFDNRPVEGLAVHRALPARGKCNRYVPPAVGQYYRWAAVEDDYLELLPRLGAADLATITGIDGIRLAKHRFHIALPEGVEPLPGSRYLARPEDTDTELNNYLNWDTQAAAALRYTKDGRTHDLLLIRPEYYQEFLTLLHEPPGTWADALPPTERLLGYLFIDEAHYATTPCHSARAVLVVDAALGDYPPDDLDLLAAW